MSNEEIELKDEALSQASGGRAVEKTLSDRTPPPEVIPTPQLHTTPVPPPPTT